MKHLKTLTFLALPLLLLSGCNKAETRYIGIISAMDIEIELLLKEANISKKEEIGGITYHVGSLKNKPVIITEAGIGKIRASSGMTSMLYHYQISNVLFTGVAGGVRDDEDVLDEVIATSVVEHDYGIIGQDGFEWCGGNPAFKEPGEVYYPDKELVDLAYTSACSVMGQEHVFKGAIATGDQFVASETYVKHLQDSFNAYACEMEGAAIAKVCTNFKTPFALLRVLSDKADGHAQDSFEDFAELAADQSSKIVLKMLEAM